MRINVEVNGKKLDESLTGAADILSKLDDYLIDAGFELKVKVVATIVELSHEEDEVI